MSQNAVERVLCTAKKGGGGGARGFSTVRDTPQKGRPNLREASRTTGNPMLCYASPHSAGTINGRGKR